MSYDLVVLFEHPEWQKPLFSALERRRINFAAFDLKRACFDPDSVPQAPLYFNQASPSAYVRGNTRAVPLALSLMRSLELGGARVLNGSRAFLLELSKSTQAALMQKLGIPHPQTLAFNDVDVALENWGNRWPALLKPEQGGSGARMYLLHSADELARVLCDCPDLWFPDNLLVLQEYFPIDASQGIVRMEFLDGELLYAMRVISHGAFNLCPSEVCNPGNGRSQCELSQTASARPVEFYPYHDVPAAAVELGKKLVTAGGFDVSGIEYLEAPDGRMVFYDMNANSNLRAPIAKAFGFDPFKRVVDSLMAQMVRRDSLAGATRFARNS
jgi:glutathione synthase/RimK-type ligase-like ATP-grasp enzyme